jgi:hypothetical protein
MVAPQQRGRVRERVEQVLEALMSRIGADAVALVHPSGAIAFHRGVSPESISSLKAFPPPAFDAAPRESECLEFEILGYGAAYGWWLHVGAAPLLLLVLCRQPRIMRFHREIRRAATESQAALDYFARHFEVVVDDFWGPGSIGWRSGR